MRKLLNKPWFVALLAAAALAFVASSIFKLQSPVGAGEVAAEEVSTEAPDEESSEAKGSPRSVAAALREVTIPSSLRDPFAARTKPPAGAEKIAEPDLTDSVTVSAIWIQGAITYVLINNRVLQVGDRIGRLTLDAATRDGVWLRHWKGRDFVTVGSAFTLLTPVREATAIAASSES